MVRSVASSWASTNFVLARHFVAAFRLRLRWVAENKDGSGGDIASSLKYDPLLSLPCPGLSTGDADVGRIFPSRTAVRLWLRDGTVRVRSDVDVVGDFESFETLAGLVFVLEFVFLLDALLVLIAAFFVVVVRSVFLFLLVET